MNVAHIAYFSATGNTKRAAGIVGEKLRQAGWSVEFLDIATGKPLGKTAADDMLVVMYPMLGLSAPKTMDDFLKGVPAGNGVKAAVVCVCGATYVKGRIVAGYGGVSAMRSLRILRKKGYVPEASTEVSYTENWTQVIAPPGERERDLMTAKGDSEVSTFADALVSRKAKILKRGIGIWFWAAAIGFVFRNFARMVLGKTFIADDSCTSCRLCARSCPAGAIRLLEGRPVWGMKCTGCNRCINMCPSNSIQTSIARFVLLVSLNLAALIAVWPFAAWMETFLFNGLPGFAGSVISFGIGFLAFCLFTLLQVGPLDIILQWLERIPAIRPIFQATFTKRFRRYLAPGFKPGAECYRE